MKSEHCACLLSLSLFRERAKREDYTFLCLDTPAESINKNPGQQQQRENKRSTAEKKLWERERKNKREREKASGNSATGCGIMSRLLLSKREREKKNSRRRKTTERQTNFRPTKRKADERRRLWIDLLSLLVVPIRTGAWLESYRRASILARETPFRSPRVFRKVSPLVFL